MKTGTLVAALVAAALMAPVVATGQGQGPGPGKGMGPGQGMGPAGKCMMMGAGPGPAPGKGMGMNYCWTRERMYGTRLMTLDERQAHMEKMWNAKTVEERNKIREEHRKLMQERAKQQQQTIDEKVDDTFTIPERQ